MPEEQVFTRIDMPEHTQATEAVNLGNADPVELHIDGNTLGHFTVNANDIGGHFTVNANDIGIDMGALWREAVAITRRVEIHLRERGTERTVYLSPDSVYDVDFHGDGVLLVGGEDDTVEITNRGFTDEKYRQLLKKVGELTKSTDPIERAVALKMVGLISEVGL